MNAKLEQKKKVYEELERLGITYEVFDHPAVYTIEEMDSLPMIADKDAIVKNLFLRDANGKRHFLVVLDKEKKADLKQLRVALNSSTLSFASEERLMKHLKLIKGAVTPFGILNNEDHKVEVVLDSSLVGRASIGVHPNDNTSTVFISYEDLSKVLRAQGNIIHIIEFDNQG